ncbi:hypothetical protein CEUSTIGMA_g11956.t1 [Chlamydomonas eustigma]|uniref:Uncharacterized protein n=1 Tax=Chlamydomonas eustigma TaxID=1157962 RepID=A0A250XN73_9CHLO|nr:hypothetical protein CEUSTIGMA_g11956.t1 [Chlamydomonas eustigma]|eukprot:GAX84535.1 hypothetical protein CEUSTIGMA_g11956.t1 [Chlamydomonas eustigma]
MEEVMEDKIRYLAKQYANSHTLDSRGLSSSIVIKNVLADNGWTQEQDGNSRCWKQQSGCYESRQPRLTSMRALLTHFSMSTDHKHLITILFDSVRAHEQSRPSKKLKCHHDLDSPPSGDIDAETHPPNLPDEISIALRHTVNGSTASQIARHIQTCTSAVQLLNKWIETGGSAIGMPRMPAELYVILQDASWLSCISPDTRSVCAQLIDNADCEVMRDAAIILYKIAEAKPKPRIQDDESDDSDEFSDDEPNETLVRELDIMNKVIDLLSPQYLNLCPDVISFATSIEDKLKARARERSDDVRALLRSLLYDDLRVLKKRKNKLKARARERSDDVRALLRSLLYDDLRVLKKRKSMARFIADSFELLHPYVASKLQN